ncbi:MAG: HAMP domain-containing sensor histidine kinase [Pseudomonadota bacterium]
MQSKLGFGAALLGIGTCATVMILWFGMQAVSDRLEAALQAEERVARYSVLSRQTASFLVVATEAIQTGLSRDDRMTRVAPIVSQMDSTFDSLHDDVRNAVESAATLGVDTQSRYATQSLGLARMEALLASALTGLNADSRDQNHLRAHIDTFSSAFDPLLSQAVNTEIRFRSEALAGINALRLRLTRIALVIAGLTVVAVVLFYFRLIRPQFRRLTQLRLAALQIGQADFAVALPNSGRDEIGQLYSETNRMAQALQARQDDIEAEWKRLNETIEERTEALRSANTTLAEIDKNRRRFFADVSHELRTPLTVILMEAQIGLKETDNPAFATIESRAARLNRRIDDLLRVARSDNGQMVLDTRDVGLAEILDAVDAEIRAEADSAGMTLSISSDIDTDLSCDPNWIRQVLASLARNAFRHARSGGQLAINATSSQGKVTLTVTDNGPGIAAEDQERVFQRFGQGGSDKAQGFGVGLALARWVIESHGGQITLTSPVPRPVALGDGPGTQIDVTLPVSQSRH